MVNLQMKAVLAEGYRSTSQKIRVITESWLAHCGYCPICGSELISAKANAKVFDFECKGCAYQYELKSKRALKLGNKITDGAYSSMMQRIVEFDSPHFFFLTYDTSLSVTNLLAVPNYFFQPSVIEQRKPLSVNARRAGWVGCNILLDQIPEIGKINLVKNSQFVPREQVLKTWKKTTFLSQQNKIEARGWTLDVMKCIDKLNTREFSLNMIYQFESELSYKYPNNHSVKDKIRQQLQVLRDRGYLDFKSRGFYSLVE